jgi:MoaA/NifB/PqqE/SkfB family radical SAM enzyme
MKQYDKDHKIQRLYVHWDVSTQCALKCSYCYAREHYGDDWDKITTWDKQLLILHALNRAKLPIFLGLLGGEPTDHPQYHELIKRCHEVVTKHPDGRLYITTNGLQPTEFFANHPIYSNTYFLFSFHPEYEMKYGRGFKLLLENIKAVKSLGFRLKVNVMLHERSKLWAKTHKFVDALEEIGGVEIHPHFVYEGGDVHTLADYSVEFYKEFERFKDYPGYLVFGDKTYNDYNLFSEDVAHFKGWSCWNNNYEISWNGIANQFCFDKYVDLSTDFNFFSRIESVEPKICPHDGCNCDGLLKIYKESPDEQVIQWR